MSLLPHHWDHRDIVEPYTVELGHLLAWWPGSTRAVVHLGLCRALALAALQHLCSQLSFSQWPTAAPPPSLPPLAQLMEVLLTSAAAVVKRFAGVKGPVNGQPPICCTLPQPPSEVGALSCWVWLVLKHS